MKCKNIKMMYWLFKLNKMSTVLNLFQIGQNDKHCVSILFRLHFIPLIKENQKYNLHRKQNEKFRDQQNRSDFRSFRISEGPDFGSYTVLIIRQYIFRCSFKFLFKFCKNMICFDCCFYTCILCNVLK